MFVNQIVGNGFPYFSKQPLIKCMPSNVFPLLISVELLFHYISVIQHRIWTVKDDRCISDTLDSPH